MERDDLGGRLPLLDPATLDPAQRRLDDVSMAVEHPWSVDSGFRLVTDEGRFIGPYDAFLRRPEVAERFRAFTSAASRHSSLSPRLREVVILAVGSVWGSAYEVYAHRLIAIATGIAERDADALAEGVAPERLGPDAVLVHALVRQLTAEHRVDGALYEQALAVFGEAGIVDIVSLAGQYLVVCGFLAVFDVPAPGPHD